MSLRSEERSGWEIYDTVKEDTLEVLTTGAPMFRSEEYEKKPAKETEKESSVKRSEKE